MSIETEGLTLADVDNELVFDDELETVTAPTNSTITITHTDLTVDLADP